MAQLKRVLHLDPAQGHRALVEVDPPAHRVDDGLRLLEDLLLHEGGELALHYLLDLHLERDDLPRDGVVGVRCVVSTMQPDHKIQV